MSKENTQRRFRLRSIAAATLAMAGLLNASIVHAHMAILTPEVPAAVADGTAKKLSALSPDQQLELAISLPLRDEVGLNAFLKDIYNPTSPDFRNYLTVSQFAERFGPTAADYAAIQDFATKNGLIIRNKAANRLVLDVAGTVSDIERAFHVHMNTYQHSTEPRTFHAPDREPTLDSDIQINSISGLDDFVLPYTHFIPGSALSQSAASGTGSGPRGSFLGSDIRAAYYGGSALTGAGQSLGLLELSGYNIADVQNYFKKVKQPLNVQVVGVAVNGARLTCNFICDDGEQVLDIEEAISMAPGLDKVVVYVGSNAVSILNKMASDNTSKQLSSSWGWGTDPESVDPIFKEFEAQGQTFVDATGDYGYELAKGVVWPADDQDVTAVGGTDLVTNGPGGAWQSETGWSGSGGGPSPNKIAIPDYQIPFINSSNQGSTTLRNVPDIAGVATNFFSCFNNKCSTGSGGTSYAAPLWAGFIALANEQAANTGKAPVGFLNPTLYALGAGSNYLADFHDQTTGFNGMYNAVTGFDLVTGFGSPQGQNLINALINGS